MLGKPVSMSKPVGLGGKLFRWSSHFSFRTRSFLEGVARSVLAGPRIAE